MKTQQIESKVKITGSKKGGYILEVSDNLGFKWDVALTSEELILIYGAIREKVLKIKR